MDEDTAKAMPGSWFESWWAGLTEEESPSESLPTLSGINKVVAEDIWNQAISLAAFRADQIANGFSEAGAPDRAYGARAVAKHLGGYK